MKVGGPFASALNEAINNRQLEAVGLSIKPWKCLRKGADARQCLQCVPIKNSVTGGREDAQFAQVAIGLDSQPHPHPALPAVVARKRWIDKPCIECGAQFSEQMVDKMRIAPYFRVLCLAGLRL